jgi:hypothetical protein
VAVIKKCKNIIGEHVEAEREDENAKSSHNDL